MSDYDDPAPNPETPWEFLPTDEQSEQTSDQQSAEDAAMHVIGLGMPIVDPEEPEEDVVVHYLEDEHPELPDTSVPPPDVDEETAEVEALLIRQHYLPPDD